ncbi:PH domain-containing protein [Paenibacillus sp. BSR1-1]|uniref:PH domain-containing protein n=1 Tax=Paenibacillus sp. BSR1-1 TaxID=3020845 RepID=UPI0025B213C2|nr:PH domain-containing protein [Paenibacillus sp. BSR1-1]MDN3019892.1 PH domain-containing protein [Paenibacillus sp. BSR1-1]
MFSEPQKRISAKALKVWRISGIIKSAIGWSITALFLFLIHIFDWPFWISVLLIVFGVIFPFLHIILFPALRWKRWRYEVREEEIELQGGIFIISRTLVPMVRVQHVDTVQGPILRKYKLASVVVHTAATAHEIPALEESEAEELRFFISKLARVAEEDV